MKKRIFKHATQTGVKLLFSILALLLVLTGCDFPTPTPPQEQVTTGTEQETQPEPVEARYDIFLSLLEKSYTEKQEFFAETYVQNINLSSYFSLPVVFERGQICLRGYLFECTYVENFEFEYSDGLLREADDAMKQTLNKMKNQKEYYFLTYEERGGKTLVCEMDNALYFLSIANEIYVGRIHVIYFE